MPPADRSVSGSILPLRFLGDPILRAKAEPVVRFDRELVEFAEQMIASMYGHKGVGLAAPQVGRSSRIIVVDAGELRDGSEAFALVNPELVGEEGSVTAEEGCLSIPGISADVPRSERVIVEGFSPQGEPKKVAADGLLARILQHEIDHLNGVLFVDRVGPLKRRMLLRAYRRGLESADAPAAAP